MQEKKIHVYFINKIKNLDLKIFEYQDEDYLNYRAVKRCEMHIRKWLEKTGIWGEKLHNEVLSCINWADDNCECECEFCWAVSQVLNAGYCKIPENAVVLTREEYASLVTRPSLNTAINVFGKFTQGNGGEVCGKAESTISTENGQTLHA